MTCYIPLFTYIISTAAGTYLTLSQRQQISGFPDACSTAYNTPLYQCSQSEIEDGGTCSMGCVALLEKVSQRINTACQGTQASPNTLIGMFFTGVGVHALCPNVQVSGGSRGSGGGNYGGSTGGNSGGDNGGGTGGDVGGGQSGQTTTVVSTSQASLDPSISSSVTTTTTTQQTSETQPTPSQTPAVVSTSQAPPEPSTSNSETETTSTQQISQTQPAASSAQPSLVKSTVSTTAPAVQPTLNTAATLTQSGLGTVSPSAFSVSSTSTSSSTSATSSAQQNSNRNGNSNDNGGTPFDISSSSHRKAAIPSMLAFALGFIALLWIV